MNAEALRYCLALRDQIAANAISGVLAQYQSYLNRDGADALIEELAANAYKLADAMLVERRTAAPCPDCKQPVSDCVCDEA